MNNKNSWILMRKGEGNLPLRQDESGFETMKRVGCVANVIGNILAGSRKS